MLFTPSGRLQIVTNQLQFHNDFSGILCSAQKDNHHTVHNWAFGSFLASLYLIFGNFAILLTTPPGNPYNIGEKYDLLGGNQL